MSWKYVEIQQKAYSKMMLHAAKYSAMPVTGILLGKAVGDQLIIEDCVPLFHSSLITPMVSVTMEQVYFIYLRYAAISALRKSLGCTLPTAPQTTLGSMNLCKNWPFKFKKSAMVPPLLFKSSLDYCLCQIIMDSKPLKRLMVNGSPLRMILMQQLVADPVFLSR